MSRIFPSLTDHVRQIAFDLKKFGKKKGSISPYLHSWADLQNVHGNGQCFPFSQEPSEKWKWLEKKKPWEKKGQHFSLSYIFKTRRGKWAEEWEFNFGQQFPLCNLCFQKSILPKKTTLSKNRFPSCIEPPKFSRVPRITGQFQVQVCLVTERAISWQMHLSLVLKAFGSLISFMSWEWTNRNAANRHLELPGIRDGICHGWISRFRGAPIVVVQRSQNPFDGGAPKERRRRCAENWSSKRVVLESPFLLCGLKVFRCLNSKP